MKERRGEEEGTEEERVTLRAGGGVFLGLVAAVVGGAVDVGGRGVV